MNWIKKNWGVFSFALFLIYYIINEGIIHSGREDFRIFLGASKALKIESDLYHTFFNMGIDKAACPYSNPPFLAFILIPFTWIGNDTIAVFVWFIFNFVFVIRIFVILGNILRPKHLQLFYFFTAILSLRFIMHNLDIAQMTIMIVYLMIEAYYQNELYQKKTISATLIGIGIAIKFLPLTMLIYWGIRKNYTMLLFSILTATIFTILPFLFFSTDYLTIQYLACLGKINPMQSGFNLQLFDNNTQGIPSIVAHYRDFFKFDWSENIQLLIINSTRAFLIIWIYSIYRKTKENDRYIILFGLCTLSFSLIMPHQQHYSYFSTVIIIAYMVDYYLKAKNNSTLVNFTFAISLILMIFTSDIFIGSLGKQICLIYKTIGLGALFLILTVHIIVKNSSKLTPPIWLNYKMR